MPRLQSVERPHPCVRPRSAVHGQLSMTASPRKLTVGCDGAVATRCASKSWASRNDAGDIEHDVRFARRRVQALVAGRCELCSHRASLFSARNPNLLGAFSSANVGTFGSRRCRRLLLVGRRNAWSPCASMGGGSRTAICAPLALVVDAPVLPMSAIRRPFASRAGIVEIRASADFFPTRLRLRRVVVRPLGQYTHDLLAAADGSQRCHGD